MCVHASSALEPNEPPAAAVLLAEAVAAVDEAAAAISAWPIAAVEDAAAAAAAADEGAVDCGGEAAGGLAAWREEAALALLGAESPTAV